MEPIHVSYQVTVSDFRRATYWGLFQRHRRALQIMLIVLAAAILYALGASAGLGQINYLVLFLAAAYLIWGLLLFAGAERSIRTYLRSENSLIGCTYNCHFEANQVRFEIPKRKIRFSVSVGKLACVFEISSMFMIYVTLQDVYFLPHRCLSEAQRTALRSYFREKLGDNFSSRFH